MISMIIRGKQARRRSFISQKVLRMFILETLVLFCCIYQNIRKIKAIPIKVKPNNTPSNSQRAFNVSKSFTQIGDDSCQEMTLKISDAIMKRMISKDHPSIKYVFPIIH